MGNERVVCVGGFCPCADPTTNPNPICKAYPTRGQVCLQLANNCGAMTACLPGLTCAGGTCALPPPSVAPPGCGPQ